MICSQKSQDSVGNLYHARVTEDRLRGKRSDVGDGSFLTDAVVLILEAMACTERIRGSRMETSDANIDHGFEP